MREDQTELISARLEHLRFLMEGGKMPIFRHRSDMFLFALEAHNIARGLSSRYYRLQEDLDIRFFVRFPFDYWLKEIEGWIKELETDRYRVDDTDFFAEGRAKRLTIVVNRLFGYHTDKLPADSAQGSMPLPNEEILEPFRKIMEMRSTDLVASYRNALQEVHTYLEKLATMPLDWPDEKRREALMLYLQDASSTEEVTKEIKEYKYNCRMPDGKTITGQFCYLRQRLLSLTQHGELAGLHLSKRQQDALLDKLAKLFGREETHPGEDQIPADAQPMADDECFAKLLYFIDFNAGRSFPVLDSDKISNYLIRKDVVLDVQQEKNLQALFALVKTMQEFFAPVTTSRGETSKLGNKRQERIDTVLTEVKRLNAKLASLLDYKRTTSEIDAFFERLFSPVWLEDYSEAQDDLLKLFEKGRDEINLKPYIRMLRAADDVLKFFKPTKAVGKKVYNCLKDEDIMSDITEDKTIQSYWSKQVYRAREESWEVAMDLVRAVEKEYNNK